LVYDAARVIDSLRIERIDWLLYLLVSGKRPEVPNEVHRPKLGHRHGRQSS